MHELSIAMSIIESVEEEIAAHPAASVERVTVTIGDLSGVVPEALRFAWEPAVRDTRLTGAALRIEEAAGSRDLLLTSIELNV